MPYKLINMELIKSNGLVSYESIGKFISTLPKDQWIPLEKQLAKQGFTKAVEALLPAFSFFQSVGHIDLREAEKQEGILEILVFTKRKKTKIKTTEIIKQIKYK